MVQEKFLNRHVISSFKAGKFFTRGLFKCNMSCNTLYHRLNDGVLDKTCHFHSSRKAFMLTNDFQNVCTLRHRGNQQIKVRKLLLKKAKP